MTAFPTRGQTAPDFWDTQLKAYIDEGDALAGGGAVSSVNGHTGVVVLNMDDPAETATNKKMTAAERTKLAGIATSATANSPDATLLARANHTGSQTSVTISDFQEAVEDAVAALFGRSTQTGISFTYNDASGTLAANVSGGSGIDAETARDTIAAALIGVGNISVVANDALDTITISTTATVNSTDAALRDRSTHTGTQLASTISDFSTAADARITAARGVTVQAYDADLDAFAAKTAPAGAVVGTTDTQTLTNKRVSKRVDAQTSLAGAPGTYTFNWDNFDAAKITAQAAPLLLANPTGTPTSMQPVLIRIKDNGTARALTYGTQWHANGVTLPTTTVVGKHLYLMGVWNSDTSQIDVLAVGQEA